MNYSKRELSVEAMGLMLIDAVNTAGGRALLPCFYCTGHNSLSRWLSLCVALQFLHPVNRRFERVEGQNLRRRNARILIRLQFRQQQSCRPPIRYLPIFTSIYTILLQFFSFIFLLKYIYFTILVHFLFIFLIIHRFTLS